MKTLRKIDLYTGLILLCLVLLPICGWWCMKTTQNITLCKTAIAEANRSGGLLEQIGALQKQIEIVNQNRGGQGVRIPGPYFEGQILLAAANQGLNASDFGLEGPKEETLSIGKQRVSDWVMDVTWKRKDLALRLDFIEALLWNCESGAGNGSSASGLQSIWKLRHLEIHNVTDERAMLKFDPPPLELEDRWSIKQMKFARREPTKA